MSAFLGPIHTWLFNKIKLQEEMLQQILQEVSNIKDISLFITEVDRKVGVLETGELADIIDEANIHGWLQQRVELVEKRLAYSVTKLLQLEGEEKAVVWSRILTAVYEFGKSKACDGLLTIREGIALIDHNLLDGMPCDHVHVIQEETEDFVIFAKTKEIHGVFWEMYDGEVTNYYELRRMFLLGLFQLSDLHIEILNTKILKIIKVQEKVEKKEAFTKGIQVLFDEHDHISELLCVMKKVCIDILDGEEIQVQLLREFIDFVRNYADQHHHGKEEKILFRVMLEELGKMANNLIQHGMLVEHDLGRLYINQLESALSNYERTPTTEYKLEILVQVGSYVDLLTRHIERENNALFTFAKRQLSEEALIGISAETEMFEKRAACEGTPSKYLLWLESLTKKIFE